MCCSKMKHLEQHLNYDTWQFILNRSRSVLYEGMQLIGNLYIKLSLAMAFQ